MFQLKISIQTGYSAKLSEAYKMSEAQRKNECAGCHTQLYSLVYLIVLDGYWHYKEVHLFFNSSFSSFLVYYSPSSPGKLGGRTCLATYELSIRQEVFGHMVAVALVEGPNIIRMKCMGKSTRITKILQNWFGSRNLITWANNWAVSIVRYFGSILKMR